MTCLLVTTDQWANSLQFTANISFKIATNMQSSTLRHWNVLYTSATKLAFTALLTSKLFGFNLLTHFTHKLRILVIEFCHWHITRSTTELNRECAYLSRQIPQRQSKMNDGRDIIKSVILSVKANQFCYGPVFSNQYSVWQTSDKVTTLTILTRTE